MIHGDTDMAPPPQDAVTFVRLPGGGWVLMFDNHPEAAFTDAAAVGRWWTDNVVAAEQSPVAPITMPSVLEAARPEQRRSVWNLVRGGKA